MGDLKDLARSIRFKGEAVEKNAREVVRRCALAIGHTVVPATPVDTGRARANWLTGLGSAPTAELPAPASPEQGVQEALDRLSGAVAGYQQGEIHIANNLPYIGALNDGHSAQAPASFVETAVAQGVRVVQSAKNFTGDLEIEMTDVGPHFGAGSRPKRKGE